MLGFSGLTQTAIAALPPAGAAVASTVEIGDRIFVLQELPDHPYSVFQAGIQGPDVQPPSIRTSIIVLQELPYHPSSIYQAGIQGPDVRVPVRDFILIRQELPWHPSSSFWVFPNDSVPSLGSGVLLMTKQEQPFHPLWPRPPLESGTQTVTEYAFAYIIP